MARQIKRDRVQRIYMARITGTRWDGQPYVQEYGPYLLRAGATAAKTRELNKRRRYSAAHVELTGEVLSAPVGEWTKEGD